MYYRKDNWPTELNRFLASRTKTPFIWGKNDCFMFACDAIKAITGYDPARGYRGSYKSPKEAYKILNGIGGMEEAMSGFLKPLNAFSANPRLLARGDVAMVELMGGRTALGIYIGRGVASAGMHGMQIVPTSKIICAWGIV